MRPPQTVEGREWLAEATDGMAELREAVGEERVVALRRSVRALHKLLYAEPSYARDVQQLALSSLCLIKTIEPELALRFGDVGRRAGLLVPEPTGVGAIRSALLELNSAEASILARRYSEAESTLDALDRRADSSLARGAVWRYIEAGSACLRGRIHEEGLEVEKAGAAYQLALDVVAPLLSRAAQRTKVVGAWMEAVTGPVDDDRLEAAVGLVVRETLAAVYVWALLGRGRVARGELDMSALLRRTLKAVAEHGLPEGLRVEQLAATVGLVADRLGVDKAFAFSESLTDDDLERAHLSPDDDRPVLDAAIAHAAASDGDELTAGVLYQTALRAAVDTGSMPTMARVLGRFVGDMIHEPDQDNDLIEALLRDLTVWGFSSASVSQKAEFEDALSTLVDYALALWNERRTPRDRMRVGILVDLLKRPQWVPLPSRWDLEPEHKDVRSLAGLWFAMDWLGRLQPTLRRHHDTGVIAIRAGRSKTVYLCASGANDDLVTAVAWTDSDDATRQLAAAARDELDFVLMSGASGGGDFEALCRAAFQELPDAVRAFIAEHDVLIVVPDERTDGESAAFELLHDGEAHLGMTKVVSRVPSLRGVVHVLEGGGRLLPRKRALVAAAPAPGGFPPLLYAAGEAEHVRVDLESEGWDVPTIEADRLGSDFLVDRLQHVAIAHLAAHGASTAGDEALLLPAGQRLTTEFLTQRRPARLPFVYLNSCFLGTTRYLGGGARRGLAHALNELGAPAVVASLNPVDDRLAAVASAAFYEEARSHPVGEAVRRVRARLADRGVAAPIWGTMVLFGDPHLRLFGATSDPENANRADDLLDSFANPEPEHWTLDRYPADFLVVLHEEADEPRLRAAALLVHSLAEAEDLEDPRAELHFAAELADQLDHRPSRALVRLKEASRLSALGYDSDAVAVLDETLPILDALHEVDPRWAEVRVQAYGLWKRMDRALNGEGEVVLEADGTAEELETRLNEMLGSQAIAERRGGDVGFRFPEQSVADVAWNAVRIGHPWPSGTFRARCELAALLAAKIERAGFAPATAPAATTLLTGILDFLWKGLAPLDHETMRRSTAMLLGAIDDIRGPWSSLPSEPWVDEIVTFQADVRSSAATAGAIPARRRQNVLREQRTSLAGGWQALADRLGRDQREALAACSAFAMGAILEAHADAPDDDPLRAEVLAHLKALLSGVGGWVEHAGLLRDYDLERLPDDLDELERWRREEGLVGAATRVRSEG
jgi:CHAT domain